MVRVASAHEAATLDAASIASGVPSRALMRLAGAQAAAVIAARAGDRLAQGVTVYTGPGNNGGDGWVVAGALARSGVTVHVCEALPAKSPDAIAERSATVDRVSLSEPPAGGVVVDALLGTGATGAPRGELKEATRRINGRRERGDFVAALDLPTGVDATTGAAHESVLADLTITFGTCKRGQLIARDRCGTIVVTDIGLTGATDDTLPVLVDQAWVARHVPLMRFDAHKGTRKKLVILAGGPGTGGAGILATQAALRSGIGMTQVVTHPTNVGAVQARVPEALTKTFPLSDDALHSVAEWADAMLLGPGLPADPETQKLIERVLRVFDGPVLLDAGALSVYAGNTARLADVLRGRQTVVTPHPVEFGRLTQCDVQTVLDGRFEIAAALAKQLGATVLLKGTPTVVTSSDGARFVSAAGTPALATGGSGDTLSGIVATLLAQTGESHVAAAAGAWIHGHAAEQCDAVRGIVLEDIVTRLPGIWETLQTTRRGGSTYPIVAEVPRVRNVV